MTYCVSEALKTLAFCLVVLLLSDRAMGDETSRLKTGSVIAFDRQKGNCLACHAVGKGESPGQLGPPLINMRTRYPDKAALRAQIWDAATKNPKTSMPPFGRHRILTEHEIDLLTDYIYSL